MSTLELPFTIGESFWLPITAWQQATVACPVCCGERIVTVILGGGERLMVPCEACERGCEGPLGTTTEWSAQPGAEPFVIDRIARFSDGEWEVYSPTDKWVRFSELCRTEVEALAISAKACAELEERNMQTRQDKRGRVGKATWSVQYHRRAIKDLERQLAWHQGRIAVKP